MLCKPISMRLAEHCFSLVLNWIVKKSINSLFWTQKTKLFSSSQRYFAPILFGARLTLRSVLRLRVFRHFCLRVRVLLWLGFCYMLFCGRVVMRILACASGAARQSWVFCCWLLALAPWLMYSKPLAAAWLRWLLPLHRFGWRFFHRFGGITLRAKNGWALLLALRVLCCLTLVVACMVII